MIKKFSLIISFSLIFFVFITKQGFCRDHLKEIIYYKKQILLSETDSAKMENLKRLSHVYIDFGYLDIAVETYKKVIEKEASLEHLLFYADLHFKTYRFAEALDIYKQVAKLNPLIPKAIRRINECQEFYKKFKLKFPITRVPKFADIYFDEMSIASKNGQIIVSSNKKLSYIGEDRLYFKLYRLSGGANKLLNDPINKLAEVPYVSYNERGTQLIASALDEKKKLNEKPQLKLFLSVKDINGNWSAPKQLQFTKDEYYYAAPYLSRKGDTLLFSSNRKGAQGGSFDIYMVHRKTPEDTIWSYPINLGKSVNTKYNETTPFLKGSLLYFSSDRPGGEGKLDIYKIKYQEQLSPKWMESPINSEYNDVGMMFLNRRIGLFVSDRPIKKNSFITENIHKFSFDSVYSPFVCKLIFKNKKNKNLRNLKLNLLNERGDVVGIEKVDSKGYFIFKKEQLNQDYSFNLYSEKEELSYNFYKGVDLHVYDEGKFTLLLNYKTGFFRFRKRNDLIAYFKNERGVKDSIKVDKDSIETQLYSELKKKSNQFVPFSIKQNKTGDFFAQGLVKDISTQKLRPGVMVYMIDPIGEVLDSAKTDKNGYFSFKRLLSKNTNSLHLKIDDAEIEILDSDFNYQSLVKENLLVPLLKNYQGEELVEGFVYDKLSNKKMGGVMVYLKDASGVIIDSAINNVKKGFKFSKLGKHQLYNLSLLAEDNEELIELDKKLGFNYDLITNVMGTFITITQEEVSKIEYFKGYAYNRLGKNKIFGKKIYLIDETGLVIDSTITDKITGKFKFNLLGRKGRKYAISFHKKIATAEIHITNSKFRYKKLLTSSKITIDIKENKDQERLLSEASGYIYNRLDKSRMKGVRVNLYNDEGELIDSVFSNAEGKFKFQKLKNTIKTRYKIRIISDDPNAFFAMEKGSKFRYKLIKNIYSVKNKKISASDNSELTSSNVFGSFIYDKLSNKSLFSKNLIFKNKDSKIIDSKIIDNIVLDKNNSFAYSLIDMKGVKSIYIRAMDKREYPIYESFSSADIFSLSPAQGEVDEIKKKATKTELIETNKMISSLINTETNTLIQVSKNNDEVLLLEGEIVLRASLQLPIKLYSINFNNEIKDSVLLTTHRAYFNFNKWERYFNYKFLIEDKTWQMSFRNKNFKANLLDVDGYTLIKDKNKMIIGSFVNLDKINGATIYLYDLNKKLLDSSVVYKSGNDFKLIKPNASGLYFISSDTEFKLSSDNEAVSEFTLYDIKKVGAKEKTYSYYLYDNSNKAYLGVKQLYAVDIFGDKKDSLIVQNQPMIELKAFYEKLKQNQHKLYALTFNGRLKRALPDNKAFSRLLVCSINKYGLNTKLEAVKIEDLKDYIKLRIKKNKIHFSPYPFFVVKYDDRKIRLFKGKIVSTISSENEKIKDLKLYLTNENSDIIDSAVVDQNNNFSFTSSLIGVEAVSNLIYNPESINLSGNLKFIPHKNKEDSKIFSITFKPYNMYRDKFFLGINFNSYKKREYTTFLGIVYDKKLDLLVYINQLTGYNSEGFKLPKEIFSIEKNWFNTFKSNEVRKVIAYDNAREFKIIDKKQRVVASNLFSYKEPGKILRQYKKPPIFSSELMINLNGEVMEKRKTFITQMVSREVFYNQSDSRNFMYNYFRENKELEDVLCENGNINYNILYNVIKEHMYSKVKFRTSIYNQDIFDDKEFFSQIFQGEGMKKNKIKSKASDFSFTRLKILLEVFYRYTYLINKMQIK